MEWFVVWTQAMRELEMVLYCFDMFRCVLQMDFYMLYVCFDCPIEDDFAF